MRGCGRDGDQVSVHALADVVVQEEDLSPTVQPSHQQPEVALEAKVGPPTGPGLQEAQSGCPSWQPVVLVTGWDIDNQSHASTGPADSHSGLGHTCVVTAERDERHAELGRKMRCAVESGSTTRSGNDDRIKSTGCRSRLVSRNI